MCSVSVVDPMIPSSASMTSRNMASFVKHSCSQLCSVDVAVSTENKSYSRPLAVSQSGSTDHELPSSGSCGRSSSLQLSPSPTRLILPGMCRTLTIWWDRTPSRQCACVALRLLLSITSCNAWQSVSTSTGKPQMTSLNLFKQNLSAANSSRNGRYRASAWEVHLDA